MKLVFVSYRAHGKGAKRGQISEGCCVIPFPLIQDWNDLQALAKAVSATGKFSQKTFSIIVLNWRRMEEPAGLLTERSGS